MVATSQVSLTTALEPEQFQELAPKLAGLPDPDSFQEAVERDLWLTFTGDATYPDITIEYKDLPDRSKKVIGYADEDKNEIPWWLHSFSWSATSHGETITLETENKLAQFEKFDPQDTTMHKPELQARKNEAGEIVYILKHFKNLYDALPDQVKTETESSASALPDEIFEIEEGTIRTTEAFKDWFIILLQLSPPLHDALTALLMTDVGIEWEALADITPQELRDCLDQIGFGENKVSNRDYRKSLRNILTLNGVFDLEVQQMSKYDTLGGLEGLFYETWAQNFAGDSEAATEWITKASGYHPEDLETGMQGKFVESVFELPLRLERGKISYTTLRVTKNKSRYWKKDQKKRKEINNIMRENGFLE